MSSISKSIIQSWHNHTFQSMSSFHFVFSTERQLRLWTSLEGPAVFHCVGLVCLTACMLSGTSQRQVFRTNDQRGCGEKVQAQARVWSGYKKTRLDLYVSYASVLASSLAKSTVVKWISNPIRATCNLATSKQLVCSTRTTK